MSNREKLSKDRPKWLSRGIARRLVIKTVLLAEETIVLLMQHAPAAVFCSVALMAIDLGGSFML